MNDLLQSSSHLALDLPAIFSPGSGQTGQGGDGGIVSIFGVCQVAYQDRARPVLVAFAHESDGILRSELIHLQTKGIREFGLDRVAVKLHDHGYAWLANCPQFHEDRRKAAGQLTRLLWKLRS